VGISEQEMAHANWRLDNPPVVDVAVSRRMGLFVVGRLAARHGVRVRLRHAQSGGLTALIWLPESVAAPESGQPLGRLRKFEADDFGPAPSLSAPPALSTMSPPAAPGGSGGSGGPFGLPGGPQGPGGGPGGPGQGGFGSAAAAAAAAARIPRFSGGARNAPGGDEDASGFTAFGGAGDGANGGTREFGPFTGKPGNGGAPGTIDAPGGLLPTRQPGGGKGPQPGAPDSGTPGAPSGPDSGTTWMPALGGDGGSAGATGPGANVGNGNGLGGSDGSQVTIPASIGPAQDQRLPIFDSLESDWFRRSGKSLSSTAASAAEQSWSSPADEGWRAARVAASPAAGENTTAGLPKRVPRANLVPGSVGGGEGTEVAPPARSAELIRTRMASFQRGVREARAAAPQNEEP
jgi:hypothetical protein